MAQGIRKTTPTPDPEAQMLNRQFNDVDRYAQAGRELHTILHQRFNGDRAEFSYWIRCNLDRSTYTVNRYLAIYENIESLKRAGIIRLKDAYRFLDIHGKPTD